MDYDFDDFNTDRMFYLYDRHQDWFDAMDSLMNLDEYPDWDMDEPSEDDLILSDLSAKLLLLDLGE